MPRELLIMQNSFQWGTAEGQTLEIENAIRSNARGLKIEGQTYQNLLSETKSLGKFVYNDITGEYTLTDPTVGTWNAMRISYTRPIQAGEKLLIRINIVKNTIEATQSPIVKITFSDGNGNLTGYKGVESGFTGLLEHYCDGATVNEIDGNGIHISTNNYTSGELVVKDIQVIPVSTNPLSYTDKTKEYVSTKSEFNYPYILENLKANTTYTLSYEIKSSNKITTNDKTTLFRIEKVTPDSNTIVKDGFTGTVDNIYRKHNLTFDTESNTKQIKINLRNQFNASSIGLAENTLSVRNLVLLEGDYTNRTMITELPTSIDGIESVAERESNNLLENVKWHDGWIDVMTGAFDSTHPSYCNAKYSDLISIDVNNNYYFSLTSNDNENVYRIRPYDADGNYVTPIDDTGNPILGNSFDIFYTYRRFFANVKYIRILLLDPTGYPPLDSLIFSQNIYTEGDSYYVKIAQSNNETDGIILPNGIKNSIENGKHIKRVGKITFNGSQTFIYAEKSNRVSCSEFVYRGSPADDIPNPTPAYFMSCVCDNPIFKEYIQSETKPAPSWESDGVEMVCAHGGRIVFIINNDRITDKTNEAINEWFKNNPTTFYYELATPITEPVTTTEIPLPQPLRSLPNGVCDEVVGNKLIQRIGKYTITGTETYDLRFENDYMFVVQFENALTETAFGDYNNSNTKMICDKALCRDCSNSTFFSKSLTIGGRLTKSKGFIIAIPKSLLSEYTIDKAKEYIKSLGEMTVYYELATPIEHAISVPRVSIAKGANIITTTNNIKPNMSMKVKVKK